MIELFKLHNYVFTSYSWPPMAVGALLAALGAAVFVRSFRSGVRFAFLLMTLSGSVWLIGFGLAGAASSAPMAARLFKIAHLGIVFIPTTLSAFTLAITKKFRLLRGFVWANVCFSILFYLQILLTQRFMQGVSHYPWGYYPYYNTSNFLFPFPVYFIYPWGDKLLDQAVGFPFLCFFFGALIVNLCVILSERRRLPAGRQKQRLKVFLIAFLAACPASADFFPAFGVPVYPFGYFFVLLFIVITARAIWRYHLEDITPEFAADQILRTMADALLVLDPEGIICVANQVACRLFEKSNTELIGKPASSISSDFFTKEHLDSLAYKDALPSHGIQYVPKHGKSLFLDVSSSAIRGRGGDVQAIVCIARDVTDWKRIEEALQRSLTELEARVQNRTADLATANKNLQAEINVRKRSERELLWKTEELARSNKELEQFAYVASHDLQEPLRKIIIFGDRLKMERAPALGSSGADFLNRMQSAALRMKLLIEDLLEFSSISAEDRPFETVDLNKTLQEVLSDLEFRIMESKGKVVVEKLPVVNADPVQMRSLFQNLVANALKFCKDNRTPFVTVTGRTLENGFAELRVRDNGIGFEEKYLDKIFSPFERLHNRQEFKGTGMGLAICQKIVSCHSGKITAQSAPGEGSTFIVTLPDLATFKKKATEWIHK